MKKHFQILLIFFAFVTGCAKNESNTPDPAPPLQDSTYIASMVMLSTSPPRDTIIKTSFYYDAQKRLSRLSEVQYSSTPPYNAIEFSGEIRYQYNGADTLPSLLLCRSVYLTHPAWYDTVRLTYQNGEIIKDSSAYGAPGTPPAYKVMNFLRIGSNNYTATFIDSVVGFSAYRQELKAGVNWQNGNLISASDTMGTAISNYSFTYDTHPNPLRKILFKFLSPGFAWNYHGDPVFGSWFLNGEFYAATVNNIVIERRPVSIEVIYRQFEYLPNGYPKSMVSSLNGLPFSKVEFFYTSL